MAPTKAKTVAEYLKELSPEHAKALSEVRKVIRKNLPKGLQETVNWGMISYEVPLKVVPKTYNGQPLMFAALRSGKSGMSLHLMPLYGDKKTEKWFRDEYKASGKKLDMGKGCVRFKKLEDLPLGLIGKAIAKVSMKDFIGFFEKARK